MSENTNSAGRRWFTIVVIVVVLVAIVATVGYAIFVNLAGSGEASQDAEEVAAANSVQEAVAEGMTLYTIDSEVSEARFYIDEVLRGQDTTVEGISEQVGAELAIDLDNPSNALIGTVVVNARTFVTDEENRNRAIRTFILQSAQDAYEFITFEPTSISGLPEEPVAVGEEITFQVTGDLTIVEATNEVTFDVTLTLNEDDTLSGLASTTILYPNFNLTIPSVPFVASVEDEVRLELDFTAVPAESAEEE